MDQSRPRCVSSVALAPPVKLTGMCRNIRTLYNFEPPATEDEVQAAALQYVRKIRPPPKREREKEGVSERAGEAGAAVGPPLPGELEPSAPQRDREGGGA